jgi:hypothetical protein
MYEGWFKQKLRTSPTSFARIVKLVKDNWSLRHPPIHYNAAFSISDRVAVTLHYLSQSVAAHESAAIFGMGKSSVLRYIKQVMEILTHESVIRETVRLPRSSAEWDIIMDGFENICGFPNVCGCIDGTLIEILRPSDYEGWYCRKMYPAINMQAIVDHKKRIMSYSIRPGSFNDAMIFKFSIDGSRIKNWIPRQGHLIGDQGYKLSYYLLIPYPEDTRNPSERKYNYKLSATRMTVEQSFGILKNRFRILKEPLKQRDHSSISQIVESCIVLHNLLINYNDDTLIEDAGDVGDVSNEQEAAYNIGDRQGLLKRDMVKTYLSTV